MFTSVSNNNILGPKNCACELDTGYTHVVIKGISLGHVTAQKLNFESIRNMVCYKSEQ